MEDQFQQHEIEWTDEKSARMWNYFGSKPGFEDSYFSNVVGDLVIDSVKRVVELKGRILDFGCGPGHLIEKLLRRGVPVEGVDFSRESIDILNKRFKGHRFFRGASYCERLPLPFADSSFDVIFLIEIIEHILPRALNSTLSEISRLLRKGGKLIATTPNKENLELNKIICPECGCVFHRIQHVHSWTRESIVKLMGTHKFRAIQCKETTFRRGDLLNLLYLAYYKIAGKTQPNLIFIGEKET